MFNTKRIKALEEELKALCDGLGIDIMYYPASKDYSMRRLYSGGKTFFEVLERRMKEMEQKEIPNIISCSTCKCLIKKEDAIRGKSEVDNKIYQFHELECDIKYEVVYESAITNKPIGFNKLLINTPYYCHSKDCKPKK